MRTALQCGVPGAPKRVLGLVQLKLNPGERRRKHSLDLTDRIASTLHSPHRRLEPGRALCIALRVPTSPTHENTLFNTL